MPHALIRLHFPLVLLETILNLTRQYRIDSDLQIPYSYRTREALAWLLLSASPSYSDGLAATLSDFECLNQALGTFTVWGTGICTKHFLGFG
jgi:hypothetical protein